MFGGGCVAGEVKMNSSLQAPKRAPDPMPEQYLGHGRVKAPITLASIGQKSRCRGDEQTI